jgi:hypothetical protein
MGGLNTLQNISSFSKTSIEIIDLIELKSFHNNQSPKSMARSNPPISFTPLTPSWLITNQILMVINGIFDIVKNNDYLQAQDMVKFKHIQGKIQASKSKLEVKGVPSP